MVKSNQNITLSPVPPLFIYYIENLTYKINAYSDSTLNLDYRLISGSNATLYGDTLEISDIGELEVRISQSGIIHLTLLQVKVLLLKFFKELPFYQTLIFLIN